MTRHRLLLLNPSLPTLLRLLLASALAGGGTAAGAFEPLTVHDDRGAAVRFEQPPQRIVTLLPSLTETVCAVGGCARLVATDRYSNQPPEVLSLPKVGGLDDAQVERIVALRPDLVLAAKSTRAVERLQSLGLRVLAFDSDTHEQARASLFAIGRLLEGEAAAARAWQAVEQQLAAAAARVPPALRGATVYFEVAADPFAAGAASFVGQTLARLGLVNIAPAAMGPFPKLNPEFVVRTRPTVVMAAARNAAEMAQRPGWAGLPALREGRVCALDAAGYELVTRPGPRLGAAAGALADCLAALPPNTAPR
ncbi:MAG: ABC transporter substrate-binding protein [Rubrivivax sp.]|nr:ABC transporter substrate-binding protein [Rubrivivax sp.]